MTEPDKKQLTLDEEADEIIRRLKAPPVIIYRCIRIPMIRKILPGLIATEITGVQSMTIPTGEIFTMKVTYDEDGNN